ncbi:MAG: hypothetical protein WAT21_12495, partial [Saprospiraceae bacterium]
MGNLSIFFILVFTVFFVPNCILGQDKKSIFLKRDESYLIQGKKIVFKKGTEMAFYNNNSIKSGTLANFADLKIIANNFPFRFKENQSIEFDNFGRVQAGTFIKDQNLIINGLNVGLVFKGGEPIRFNNLGKVISGKLLIDTTCKTPRGNVLLKGWCDIEFNSKGQVIRGTIINSGT